MSAAASAVYALVVGCGVSEPAPAVTSVDVTPNAVQLAALGDAAQLTARARDAEGRVIGGRTFVWQSSDARLVAVDSTGLVTALRNGSATITATTAGIQGSAGVSVAQHVASIRITPAADTLPSLGDTVRLRVAAYDANDSAVAGPAAVTWVALDTAVAIVDAGGVVTSLDNGVTGIAAIHETAADTAWMTVRQVATRVAVAPASAALAAIGTTAEFGATAYDANDSLIAGATVDWSSLNTDVVAITAEGLATARRDGQGTVAATADSAAGYALLTIAVPGPAPSRTWERGWFQPHEILGIWGGGPGDVWTVGQAGTEGRMAHYDGIAWIDEPPGLMRETLSAVWGSGPGDVWAVGAAAQSTGFVFHFDGASWRDVTPTIITDGGLSTSLRCVWGTGPADVWVGGLNGVWRYDGDAWAEVGNVVSVDGMWGTRSDDVWAVGPRGSILHYDGVTWSTDSVVGKNLFGVWGSGPSDVWAVGEDGVVLHYDGAAWAVAIAPPPNPAPELRAVWGADSAHVWAVGEAGTILRFDGTAWVDESPSVPAEYDFFVSFAAVWGTGPTDVWAGGGRGLLMHYDGMSWSRARQGGLPVAFTDVWGSSGADLWAVGRDATITASLAHYDGTNWTDRSDDVPPSLSPWTDLCGVWGTGPGQAWTLGGGLRYDGSEWIHEGDGYGCSIWGTSPEDWWVVGTSWVMHYHDGAWANTGVGVGRDIWGTAPDDVWLVGDRGAILHWDGASWNDVSLGAVTRTLFAVWGSGPSDVWAVGHGVTVLHFDGLHWSDVTPPGITGRLYDVWGTGPADVWAVGTPMVSPPTLPIILHYDGSTWSDVTPELTASNLNAVFGTRSGDVWAVGDDGIVLRARPAGGGAPR